MMPLINGEIAFYFFAVLVLSFNSRLLRYSQKFITSNSKADIFFQGGKYLVYFEEDDTTYDVYSKTIRAQVLALIIWL